jgi:hypothetical protein
LKARGRPDEDEEVARHPEGPFVVRPFDHRQHVRFAWSVLQETPGWAGEEAVADEIRDFAAVAAPGRYHDTLPRFWLDPDLVPLP